MGFFVTALAIAVVILIQHILQLKKRVRELATPEIRPGVPADRLPQRIIAKTVAPGDTLKLELPGQLYRTEAGYEIGIVPAVGLRVEGTYAYLHVAEKDRDATAATTVACEEFAFKSGPVSFAILVDSGDVTVADMLGGETEVALHLQYVIAGAVTVVSDPFPGTTHVDTKSLEELPEEHRHSLFALKEPDACYLWSCHAHFRGTARNPWTSCCGWCLLGDCECGPQATPWCLGWKKCSCR